MLVNLIRGFLDLGQPVDLVLMRASGPHLARLPAEVNRIELGPTTACSPPRRWPAICGAVARRPAGGQGSRRPGRRAGPDAGRHGHPPGDASGHPPLGGDGRKTGARALAALCPIRLLYPRIDHIVAVSDGVAQDTARIARLPSASASA
jgi:hypothetical protein